MPVEDGYGISISGGGKSIGADGPADTSGGAAGGRRSLTSANAELTKSLDTPSFSTSWLM